MLAAVAWGALAGSSLLIGALLAVIRRWPDALIGGVLAFGAGALVSAVAYDLAQEGLQQSGPFAVAVDALGAMSFTV